MAQARRARARGRRIAAANCCNVKLGTPPNCARIELNECGHPVPDARAGVAGAERIGGKLRPRRASRSMVMLPSSRRCLGLCLSRPGAARAYPEESRPPPPPCCWP